jgi:small nuclear ribonucleoprotein G
MAPTHVKGPDLKRFMDKKLRLTLNGNRKLVGTLRGFDPFLNVVLEETVDESVTDGSGYIGQIVIRGNSISQFETLERIRK